MRRADGSTFVPEQSPLTGNEETVRDTIQDPLTKVFLNAGVIAIFTKPEWFAPFCSLFYKHVVEKKATGRTVWMKDFSDDITHQEWRDFFPAHEPSETRKEYKFTPLLILNCMSYLKIINATLSTLETLDGSDVIPDRSKALDAFKTFSWLLPASDRAEVLAEKSTLVAIELAKGKLSKVRNQIFSALVALNLCRDDKPIAQPLPSWWRAPGS